MSFAATAQDFDTPPSALRAWDRRFAAVLVGSLLLHALIIFTLHKPEPVNGLAAPRGPLNVRLQPRAEPPPPTEAAPPPPPKPVQRNLMTAPRRNPERPAIPLPPPEPPPVEPPPRPVPPTPAPPQMSFEEMVAARRSQRAPTVSEHAAARADAEAREAGGRRDAILARNLGTLKTDGTSGVFEVINKGSRYGTFRFNGWKQDVANKWRETIEVDAGLNGDVELAIVRRMIDVIRMHYQGDFNWESQRLGRVVKLSARPQDQPGLESFMLREFFVER